MKKDDKRRKGNSNIKGYKKSTGKMTRLSVHNDDKSTRKKGQGAKSILKEDTIEFQQKIERVYELLKEGMRGDEIHATLCVEGEDIGKQAFLELQRHAWKYAEVELHKDREYTFQLHMDRYEKIYQQSMIIEDTWHRPLDKKKDWRLITMKYINALKALVSKENLLGLHDKSLVVEFNDMKAVVATKPENRGAEGIPGYDLTQLTLEEQIELLGYIKDARTVPIEGIQRVIVRKTVIEINPTTGEKNKYTDEKKIDNVQTYDIEYEEMPKNVVEKFQEIHPEEEVEEQSGIIVEDSRPKTEGRELSQITDSIKNNLLAKLQKNKKKKS